MFDIIEKTEIKHKGIALILSSPSGAGKSSVSHALMERNPNFSLSISVTTRPSRPGEEEGKHYHFKTQKEFDDLLEKEAFLEWAKVFGNQYGTLRQPVEEALHAGRDIIFDIDWQGTQQLCQSIRPDVVSIFLLPPSLKELETRLYKRAQDHEYIIMDRMTKAIDEISHWPEYDYVLINDQFETTVDQILKIVSSEKLRRRRQVGLEKFIKTLVE
ncbi:MAG: guanylate kinase [Alphaproteobacteria bacterium RIFCSPHIGHO2_01_FULL_41_14]|nr:MAG: guanylate kinase [Alphaproteobacteria bacterium GWB1_45_5]OFW75857.1 MAG: guanylate kinase [Alphaproteobacteria bacterium GWA1_45_9]OFW89946.1 MAG: guanylate kinase [Alphaproteobacteria bacterium RIFCSPHIGHO2_01_FULL_41_14]HCI48386.1 guanylate kinase [Holosporales bacterium]